jgi:hypothetical protein
MNNGCFTQLSFTLGAFFGQNMTSVRLFALKTACAGFLKALACAAMAFHFWHLFSPMIKNKVPEIKPSEAKYLAPLDFWQTKSTTTRLHPERASCFRNS